jgi:hypothetical protein
MGVITRRILELVSFLAAVVGATLVALNIGIGLYGYILFTASSIATIILLRHSNASKVIEWQTYVFVIVNVVGIIRHLQ